MVIPKLKAPIVLVHGLFGFDRIALAGMTLAHYFPGIVGMLKKADNRVLIPFLSPMAGVAERSSQLKAFLDKEAPGESYHIFAHSMGGLDSRYMISKLDMGERVLTLTTLGTPHRGTTFADWGIQRLERLVKPIFDLLGLNGKGFYDLTTAGCKAFNDEVKDDARVRYFSVAGRHDGHWMSPEWLLPYYIVLEAEGPNDGVVSLASAQYGESMEVWEGDHFSLVNWPSVTRSRVRSSRSIASLWRSILERVRGVE